MTNVTASSQDYLEAILELSEERGYVRSVDIAEKLGVSRASVNRAVGVLKKAGLVLQEHYSNISLTEEGRKVALKVLARHQTLKSFLTDVLGVSEDTAQKDACRMEHSISDETFEKLKKYNDKLQKF